MNGSRTLVIGLDGATFDLLDPLVRAGDLPVVAGLVRRGAHGRLQCWPNTNSAAAWSSMITGSNPGQHGVYGFGSAAPEPGRRYRPTTAGDRARDPFWRLLSAAGQRVGVVNVPITYPADRINGFMLAGMDTPAVGSAGFAHPPGLRDELRRAGIDYVIDVPNLAALRRRDPHRLPRVVERMVAARARAVLHLIRRHPWDALMAVLVAPDRVQHSFWPADGTSVDHPSWTPLRSLYRLIDAFLGEALALAGPDTTVLIVSDHGFGPRRPPMHSLNALFARLGLLRFREGPGRVPGRLLWHLLLHGRRIVPRSLQRPLAAAFPGLHLRAVAGHTLAGIEWSGTRVFDDGLGWEVSINLRGPRPEGVVPPDEYPRLRDQVREVLLGLRDPASGRPLVRAVQSRDELFHGPYSERAADLMVDWDYDALGDALAHPGLPEPIVEEWSRGAGRGWVGSHRPDGIFIAAGTHVRAGTAVCPTIYDVAPTVLHLQGHPIPADVDGRVLTEILTDEFLRSHPVRWDGPAGGRRESARPVLAPGEERVVEERLRGLGYIE